MPNDFTRNLDGVSSRRFDSNGRLGILEECHSVSHLVDLAHLQCLCESSTTEIMVHCNSIDTTYSLKDSRSRLGMPTLQIRPKLNTLVEYLMKVGFGGQWAYRTICEDTRGQVSKAAWGILVEEGCQISRVSIIGITILGRCLEVHKF